MLDILKDKKILDIKTQEKLQLRSLFLYFWPWVSASFPHISKSANIFA